MPKKIAVLIFIVLIIFSQSLKVLADNGVEKKSYRIGVSSRTFGNVNNNDAAAALKAWSLMVEKEQKTPVRFEAQLLTGSAIKLKESFTGGELDGVALSVLDFFETDLSPEFVYIGKRGNGLKVNYIIISHSQGKISSTRDLADCKIVTCDNNQMITSLQWLEIILFEHTDGKKIQSPALAENYSKAILQVFFRQADAAMITREAFSLACELNPQLKRDIKVICESPPLIPVLFLLQPSTEQNPDLAFLEKIVMNMGNSRAGRQILTVIQSSSLEKHPVSVVDTTFQLLKKHEALVKAPVFMEVSF